MNDEDLVSLVSKIILEVTFLGLSIWYLIKLHNLNDALKENVEDIHNAFEVATYNNNQPMLYALIALIIAIVAVVLPFWFFRVASYKEFYRPYTILMIFSIVANIAIIWKTWALINNPILRAVIVVLIAGIGVLAAMSSSSA